MRDWMAQLVRKEKRLWDIVLPASHDAGMYLEIDRSGNKRKTNGRTSSITQSQPLFEQLLSASRMFDLRIYTHKTTGELHSGHFPDRNRSMIPAGTARLTRQAFAFNFILL